MRAGVLAGILAGALAAVVAAVVAMGAVCGLATPEARAAELQPDATWKEMQIGVLPVISYSRGPEDVFAERPEVRRLRERAGEWQRQLEAALSTRDKVVVLGTARVRDRLSSLDGIGRTLAVARERAALGRERYRGLKLERARQDLRRAEALYLEAFGDLLTPVELASVAFYRGLSRVDEGNPEQAATPFREMLLLDPGRTFQKGYYPAATEAALTAAVSDMNAQRGKVLMRYPLERLAQLAEKARVDALAIAFIDGPPERPHVQFVVFDRRTRGIAAAEQIPLGSDDTRALDVLDRAISAWHSCNIETDTSPKVFRPARQSHVYVDLGYSHTLFLGRPDSLALFHSLGAAIGVTYESPKNFLVYGRIIQMASLDDPMEDLRDTFLTTRIAAGAGLVGGSRRVRVYLQAGLELAVTVSDITLETDPACKFFEYGDRPGVSAQDPCRKSGPKRLEAPGLAFGFHVGTGFRWLFAKSWYTQLTASLTTYVIQGTTGLEMNFPLTFGAGIGNRF